MPVLRGGRCLINEVPQYITSLSGDESRFLLRGLGTSLGVGFGFWVLEFRVSGVGFWVSGQEFRVSGFGFWASGFRFRVLGFRFRVLGCDFGGFRVSFPADTYDGQESFQES